MDRYFYTVEFVGGNKVVHVSGNAYLNDVDTMETNYRIAEWTFLYIPIEQLEELIKNNWFYEYVNEQVNYLEDITQSEAVKICEEYFDGSSGTYLHIKDVNMETPCGCYWFE